MTWTGLGGDLEICGASSSIHHVLSDLMPLPVLVGRAAFCQSCGTVVSFYIAQLYDMYASNMRQKVKYESLR